MLQFLMGKLREKEFYRRHLGDFIFFAILLAVYLLLRRKYDWASLAMLMTAGGLVFFFAGKWGKVIFLIFLAVLTCFERHFALHYNSCFMEIGSQTLLALQITHSGEIRTYLTLLEPVEYILPVLFAAVIYAFCRFAPAVKGSKIQYVAVLFALAAVLYNIYPPLSSFYRDAELLQKILTVRKNFKFDSKDVSGEKRSRFILVIGESHRYDAFGDLTSEKFAPILHRGLGDGDLIAFSDMISCYPQTWYALFSCLTRRTNTLDRYWPERGIPSLFKEAGYKVYVVTHHLALPPVSGYDFVMDEGDRYINHPDFSGSRMDRAMIPVVKKLFDEKSDKVLIIIKMLGAHFNFQDRYTPEFKVHTPAIEGEGGAAYNDIANRELIFNTYRNAVLYSGAFLNDLAEMVQNAPVPAAMSFLSDHGIGLYDDGENKFFGKVKSNYHIPFFIFGNTAYWSGMGKRLKSTLELHKDAPLTNYYLFDTMAALANIDYPAKRPEMDISSAVFRPAEERTVYVWQTPCRYDDLK